MTCLAVKKKLQGMPKAKTNTEEKKQSSETNLYMT